MRGRVVGLIALLVLVPGPGWTAQTAERSTESASAAYSQWIDVMADFTRGVEVDEGGMHAFLDHWRDLSELDITDSDEEDAAEFKTSLQEALADSRYRGWAEERGLEPEEFLRGSMRIMSLVMVRQAEGQEAVAAQQWKDHAAVVEEQCAQADDQTCRQMRQALADLRAMGEAMKKARDKLPPPSAREAALLDRYGAELESFMMEDDDESEDDYDDYEDDDYEDDDYYEEDDDGLPSGSGRS